MTTPTTAALLAAGDIASFLTHRAHRVAADIRRLRSEMAAMATSATAASAAGHASIAATIFANMERRQAELASAIEEQTTLAAQTAPAPEAA